MSNQDKLSIFKERLSGVRREEDEREGSREEERGDLRIYTKVSVLVK